MKLYSTIIIILFYFYDYLLQVTISIMPIADYSISPIMFSFISSAFFLGYVLPQAHIGEYIDKGYFKKIAISLVFICIAGLYLFSQTNNVSTLILARFLMGVGSSCSCIMAVYAITSWFETKHTAILIGFVQMAACLGGIFGQAVLSKIISAYSWHGGLNILLVFGFMMFLLCISILDVKNNPILKISDNSQKINKFKLMQDKQVFSLAVCGFVAWCAISVIASTWIIKVLTIKYNIEVSSASVLTIPLWIGLGFGSFIIVPLSNYIRSRKNTIYLAFVCQIVSYSYLVFNTQQSLITLELIMFVLGVTASIQTLSLFMISEFKNKQYIATKIAIINLFAAFSGGAVNPIIGIAFYYTNDIGLALLVLPLISIIGIIITKNYMTETYIGTDFSKSSIIAKS